MDGFLQDQEYSHKPGLRGVVSGKGVPDYLGPLGRDMVEHSQNKIVLGRIVMVEGHSGYTGFSDDLINPDIGDPMKIKKIGGRFENTGPDNI